MSFDPNKMREISFVTNIIGAILTGIALAYVSSINDNQKTFSNKLAAVAIDVQDVKGTVELQAYIISNNTENLKRIDEIQRKQSPTFEGMNKFLFDRHEKYIGNIDRK